MTQVGRESRQQHFGTCHCERAELLTALLADRSVHG